MNAPKILLAINYANYSNERKKKLQKVAISVLEKIKPKNVGIASFNFPEDKVDVPAAWRVFKMLKRDPVKDLGNDRKLPYIKEIFDICVKANCHIFGYINSDILLRKGFFDNFNDNNDAYVFYKRDIEEVSANDFVDGKFKIVDNKPLGVDGIFFNRIWWYNYSDMFPNGLVAGETEWDTVYNSIIQKNIPKHAVRRELHHVYHDRIWRLDSRAAINNTLIWNSVRDKYGEPKFIPETKV
jgi:hypothetical protein